MDVSLILYDRGNSLRNSIKSNLRHIKIDFFMGSGSFRPFYLFALGRFALQVGRFTPQCESFRPSLYFSRYSTII